MLLAAYADVAIRRAISFILIYTWSERFMLVYRVCLPLLFSMKCYSVVCELVANIVATQRLQFQFRSFAPDNIRSPNQVNNIAITVASIVVDLIKKIIQLIGPSANYAKRNLNEIKVTTRKSAIKIRSKQKVILHSNLTVYTHRKCAIV